MLRVYRFFHHALRTFGDELGSEVIHELICQLSFNSVYGGGFYSTAVNMPIDQLLETKVNADKIIEEINRKNKSSKNGL